MTEREVLAEDLSNAWCAVVQQYVDSPDESLRLAANLLVKVRNELDRRLRERDRELTAASVQEWIELLKGAEAQRLS